MAIGKWISFSHQQSAVADTPLAKPLPIPCADGKRFGLENFGNTCYANSVLQALYFCSPFRELVIQHTDPYASLQQALTSHSCPTTVPSSPGTAARRKPERKSIQDSPPNAVPQPPIPPVPSAPRTLFSALRSLYIHISQNPADKGTVAPRVFIEKLRELNEAFRNTMHQDAHEFLNYLLNRIVEEIEEEKKHRASSGDDLPHSVKSSSTASHPPHMTASTSTASAPSPGATFIHQIFEGTLTSETRCLTCENVSSRDESFLDLSIDIEQNSSLTACLRQFSASEMLCQKEKFFCDACCDLQEAERRMKIKRLPNVLALHLKRFKYQEDVQKYIKLAYRVAFPFELRLFNTVDDIPNPDRLYELFAIVVHIGNGPNHGHYVSIIKTMCAWLIFDDETVDTIKECDIPKYFGESNSGSAYVLYYQAVDIDLATLGLHPSSPDPIPLTAPQSEPSPPQWQPTDSPVSAMQPIPPLPPGLNDVLKSSAHVPDALPQLAVPPIPIQLPLEPSEKSPRKMPSQFLKVGIRRPTTSQGFARNDASLRASQTTTDDEKSSSASKPNLSPITIFPKEDLNYPEPASPAVVNGKEKESENTVMSWLRRKSFKSGKPRPSSVTNGEKPPLPADLATGPPGSPVQPQSATVSSNSSKDLRRLVEPTPSAHPSPFPTKSPSLSRLTGGPPPHDKSYRQSPASPTYHTTPLIPPPDRLSQPRPLPTIPASPLTPKVEPIPPPSSYSRTSTDYNYAQRRIASITDFHPPPSPKTSGRPATSAGAPTPKGLPPLPSVPPGRALLVHSPETAAINSVGRSESPSGRPKSAHASYSLGMMSPISPMSPPPPVSVASFGAGMKRAKRKLSLTAPILGFGKRDKDKEKLRDKTGDRSLSHTMSDPLPTPMPHA